MNIEITRRSNPKTPEIVKETNFNFQPASSHSKQLINKFISRYSLPSGNICEINSTDVNKRIKAETINGTGMEIPFLEK